MCECSASVTSLLILRPIYIYPFRSISVKKTDNYFKFWFEWYSFRNIYQIATQTLNVVHYTIVECVLLYKCGGFSQVVNISLLSELSPVSGICRILVLNWFAKFTGYVLCSISQSIAIMPQLI